MEVAITEYGYEKTDNLAKMDKDKVMALKYSKSSIDTPVPVKSKKKLLHLLWWRDYTVSFKSDRLMPPADWMELTQDDYEDFQSKQAENIYRSREGYSVAENKKIEGTSAYDFRKGHKRDISEFAS